MLNVLTFEKVFGPITGKRDKYRDMKTALWKTLDVDTYFQGMHLKAGTQYKAFETRDFGWIVLHPDTQCIDGSFPGRRLYKF